MAEAAYAPFANRPPELRGRLVIAPRAVERIAATAAKHTTDVVAQAGKFGRRLPRASAEVSRSTVQVNLDIATAWGVSLPGIAAIVRTRVAERVAELTSLTVEAVDVAITAVLVGDEVAAAGVPVIAAQPVVPAPGMSDIEDAGAADSAIAYSPLDGEVDEAAPQEPDSQASR